MTKVSHAINIQDVTKTFGNHTVLHHMNFQIAKGKITTILGFSGAGKSTLMKHILGIMKPTKGRIEVLGVDLRTQDEFQLREFRRNFGMVFQYAALFDSLSAFENVAFPLREFDKPPEAVLQEKVSSLLTSVGIEEISFHKLPSELSGGMRKRVGLARALALNPQIMLYDEPTTGLDPITTKMVNQLIKSTAKMHEDIPLTSLIISHDIKATLEISDFVAFLDHGRIIEHLPIEEFTRTQNPLVRQFLDL